MERKREYVGKERVLIDERNGWKLIERDYIDSFGPEDKEETKKGKVCGPFLILDEGSTEEKGIEQEFLMPDGNGSYESISINDGRECEFNAASFASRVEKILEDWKMEEDMEAEEQAWLDEQFPELKNTGAVPNEPLGLIRFEFAKMYAPVKLSLPVEDVQQRRAGSLNYEFGGSIAYRFGKEGNREYAVIHDYGNRMSGHENCGRIYEDGEVTLLACDCSGEEGEEEEEEDMSDV